MGRRDFLKLGLASTRRVALKTYGIYAALTGAALFAEEKAFNHLEDVLFGEYRSTLEELEQLKRVIARDIGIALELVENEIPERLNAQSHQLQTMYDLHVVDWQSLEIITIEESVALEQVITNLQRYESSYTQWESFKELYDRVTLRVAQAGREVESRLPPFIQDIHEGIHRIPIIGAGTAQERETAYDRLDTLIQVYDNNRDNLLAQEAVIEQINTYLADSQLSTEERELYGYLRDQMVLSQQRGDVNQDVREFILNYDDISNGLVEREQLESLQEIMGRIDQIFDDYVPVVQELQDNLDQGLEMVTKLRDYNFQIDESGAILSEYQQDVLDVHDQLGRLKDNLEDLDIIVDYEPEFQIDITVPEVVDRAVNVAKYLTMAVTGIASPN